MANYPKKTGFNLYQSRHCVYITYSVKPSQHNMIQRGWKKGGNCILFLLVEKIAIFFPYWLKTYIAKNAKNQRMRKKAKNENQSTTLPRKSSLKIFMIKSYRKFIDYNKQGSIYPDSFLKNWRKKVNWKNKTKKI